MNGQGLAPVPQNPMGNGKVCHRELIVRIFLQALTIILDRVSGLSFLVQEIVAQMKIHLRVGRIVLQGTLEQLQSFFFSFHLQVQVAEFGKKLPVLGVRFHGTLEVVQCAVRNCIRRRRSAPY